MSTWSKTRYESSPCHSCTTETGRYPGCHTSCSKYQGHKKKTNAIKNARHSLHGEMSDYVRARRNRV